VFELEIGIDYPAILYSGGETLRYLCWYQSSGMTERGRRNHRFDRRHADRGHDDNQRDPRDVEAITRLQQRIRDLELQHGDYCEPTDMDSVFQDDESDTYNLFGRERPYQHRDSPADPLRNLGIKIELPEFDGRAQLDEFIDWLHTVERVFDLRDIPDRYKVKQVVIKLKKYASLWWEHVKKKRAREGRSRVTTWDKMKKLLKEIFLPPTYRQEAFPKYHNLSQRTTTVEELIMEFDQLRMKCGVEEEEEQTIAWFLGALRPDIADIV
nr:reverse transcriptase domain-containing protein [Tanacetum cinerariifolium]